MPHGVADAIGTSRTRCRRMMAFGLRLRADVAGAGGRNRRRLCQSELVQRLVADGWRRRGCGRRCRGRASRRDVLPHAVGRPASPSLPLHLDLDEAADAAVSSRCSCRCWRADAPAGDSRRAGAADRRAARSVGAGGRRSTVTGARFGARTGESAVDRRQARDLGRRIRQQDAQARQREEPLRVDVALRRRAGVLVRALRWPPDQLDRLRVGRAVAVEVGDERQIEPLRAGVAVADVARIGADRQPRPVRVRSARSASASAESSR